MAKSVNKVVLLGNVGNPPNVRKTRSSMVAELSFATNERRPDGHGGWQDHTEWHTLVAFGRLAEIVSEYVHVGAHLYIEGKLRTDSWEDKGLKRYWTKIVVLNLVLLSRNESHPPGAEMMQDVRDLASPYAFIPEGEITPEEIPF